MELSQYLNLFRKRLWIVLVVAIIGGGLAFLANREQPELYRAKLTLLTGTYIESPNPSSTEIRTGMELVPTYIALLNTYDILNATVEATGIPITADRLRQLIAVRVPEGTSLLEIEVIWGDPEQAQALVTELAQQLITNSPTNLTPEQREQVDQANEEIRTLNGQIVELRARLAQINEQITRTTNAETLSRLALQRDTTISQINDTALAIAEFTQTVSGLQARINRLEIVENPRVQRLPGNSVVRDVLVGASIAGVLTIVIILILEYLRETIKTSRDVASVVGIPVLGVIGRFNGRGNSHNKRLVSSLPPSSKTVEAYRKARTMVFAGANDHPSVYLITSAAQGEGKTLTSANLAIMAANSGMRVLLIDADLRRPMLHQLFGADNNAGLTTLLDITTGTNGNTPYPNHQDLITRLRGIAEQTTLQHLILLTSGPADEDAYDLLASPSLRPLIEALRASNLFDLVLIDTAPCLVAADSAVIALTTQAEVLLVVQAGRTRRHAIMKAKEEFEKIRRPIRGLILNQVDLSEEYSDYGSLERPARGKPRRKAAAQPVRVVTTANEQ